MEVEETGTTYAMNAWLKARAWVSASGIPSLADDSGLEVRGLNFAPGIFSARAADGSDEARNRWLLGRMEGRTDRRAAFVAALALSFPDGRTLVCEGECRGTLTDRPLGSGGFGYDPLFVPEGQELTFAQMAPEAKDGLSHRAVALKVLLELLPDGVFA